MLEVDNAAEPLAEVETERGRMTVARVAAGILHSSASGVLEPPVADALIPILEAEIAAGHPDFEHFMDWRHVTGYASEVRVRLTAWAMSASAPYPRLHILVANRMVHMGVSAAALALALAGRHLASYTSAAAFDAELARHATG